MRRASRPGPVRVFALALALFALDAGCTSRPRMEACRFGQSDATGITEVLILGARRVQWAEGYNVEFEILARGPARPKCIAQRSELLEGARVTSTNDTPVRAFNSRGGVRSYPVYHFEGIFDATPPTLRVTTLGQTFEMPVCDDLADACVVVAVPDASPDVGP